VEEFPLREVLDSLREGLQVLSPEWRYLYANEAVARHGRRAVADLVGHTMLECYPGIDRTPLFAVLDRCMRERTPAEFETEFVYPDGQRAWFELRVAPCAAGLVVLSVDITERKQLLEKMMQMDKLRALGQMAAGVAHDLKNILNPIGLQLALLKKRNPDPEAREIMDQMKGILHHGAQTIDLLRDLASEAPLRKPPPISPDDVAHQAVELCRVRAMQCPVPVRVVEALGGAPEIRVNAPELLSALVNLMTNALDALPSGGCVTVRSGRTDEGVWVEVEDDGVGMPPEVEARAFEPFFTTKGAGGTGLGLAMVYALASRHDGRVKLATQSGHGTTVRLVFPPAT
jgi:PAS domain S-box-containing protein